jgi:hypothetical protein
MERQLGLARAMLSTLGTSYSERAVLVMLVKLGLARQNTLASLALEVIALQMLSERGLIWAVETTTWL